MAKFEPIYNEEGRVKDPRIAHVMAKSENNARIGTSHLKEEDEIRPNFIDPEIKCATKREHIDYLTNKVGEKEYREIIRENLAKKIRASLSPEEIEIIEDIRRGWDKAPDERHKNLDSEIFLRHICRE